MTRWVTVSEAAEVLGVHEDTVKRRLKMGQLLGRQEQTPRGFRWLVEVPVLEEEVGGTDGDAVAAPGASATATVASTAQPLHAEQLELVLLRQRVAELERDQQEARRREEHLWSQLAHFWDELERRGREVSELHILLQRAQDGHRAPVYLPRHRTAPTVSAAAASLLVSIRQSRWWQRVVGA